MGCGSNYCKGSDEAWQAVGFLCQENAVHLLDLKVKSLGCNRKTQVFSEAVADKLSALKPLRCTAFQVFLMKLFLSTWRAGTLQRIYSRIGHAWITGLVLWGGNCGIGPMVFGNFGRMLHKLAEQNLMDKAQCLS